MVRWVLLLIAVAACGGSTQTCPLVPRPAVTQPWLWKAQKADGPIVWLYGTIHTAGGDDVPQAVWSALESSPKVVTELGDTEADPEKTKELVLLAPGKGLDQLLPANDWYDLRDALRGVIKEVDLRRVRPWFARARLVAKFAPSPSPTMDFAIPKRARAKGKPVDALESWAVQLAAVADEVTIAHLQEAIRGRHGIRCSLDKGKSVYMTGDLAAMTTVFGGEASSKLVVDRNKAWMPQIEGLFATGGFVAVGISHMLSDEGLPAMLERAGYRVERVR